MMLIKKPHTNLNPLFLSVFRCSSSCAALRTAEINYPFDGFHGFETPLFPEGFKKTPRRLYNHNLPNSITFGTRIGRGGVLDRKQWLKWFSEVLHNCASGRSIREGKAIHSQIFRSGIVLDSHLWVSLINFYAKCRCLACASQVLDEMPERDVVSWTALISGFVAEGYSCDASSLLREMQKEGIRPNEFTLSTVLKACSMEADMEFGIQLHAEVIKDGVFTDMYVGSAVVDLYAKCGDMENAAKVFYSMLKRNAVLWNALLNGYAQLGDGEEILRLFCCMKETEMKFNKFTLCNVLKGCALTGDLGSGQLLHSIAIKVGHEPEEFLSCSLVDLYSKCGLDDDALNLFLRIKCPDIVTWSAMIGCLAQQGRKQEAAVLFRSMKHAGLTPNQFTLASLVNAATNLGGPLYCKSIHACVYKYGFESDNVVSNALITMYMGLESFRDGYQVFNAMSHWDVISWNSLLSGFRDKETCDPGTTIFKQMLVEGFTPNTSTYVSTLRLCTSLSDISFGKQVHAHIVKDSLDGDNYIGTTLIDMYAKCRCMEDVEVIFNKLYEKDLCTWNTVITCYAQNSQGEKSIQYFNQMLKEGLKPNEFTVASCLRGCSGIASLVNGRQLHSLAIKSGNFDDIVVASAIIDMYGKCGCIDEAEIIFKGMDSHDTVSWNTIICEYSRHGQREKALEAFKNMLDECVSPDGVTFLGILSACRHTDLVEEGKKHFYSMTEVYGLTPSIEHYACMVDIIGRADKLDEVESFIEKMNLTPNALIWESVLGVCKVHGNAELGERTAEKLFQLKPDIDSNYISLSNIFAANGMWDDSSQVRALMSGRGVKKETGCSWVEVDAQIHVFRSQDASHPRIWEVYQKLGELRDKLSSVGYMPNVEGVLHNVTGREKTDSLDNHSERLAVAFALINSIPNKTIRIFKNVRTCEDCHEYMKLISDITNQEIVVRDINRFHHFQNGVCSCQDYW